MLPDCHRKSMSYFHRHRPNLCNFGSRLRLRDSHVSTKQTVNRVKSPLATYYLKCLMVHKTAIHSPSVEFRLEPVFQKRWLAKVKTRFSCPTGCRSTASTPAEQASVSTTLIELSPANDLRGWMQSALLASRRMVCVDSMLPKLFVGEAMRRVATTKTHESRVARVFPCLLVYVLVSFLYDRHI